MYTLTLPFSVELGVITTFGAELYDEVNVYVFASNSSVQVKVPPSTCVPDDKIFSLNPQSIFLLISFFLSDVF